MMRGVNATLIPFLLLLAACRSSGSAPAAAAHGEASLDAGAAPTDGASDAPQVEPGAELAREESARFFPAPYDNLWIGEPLGVVRQDYPDIRPYASPTDPERLDWRETQGENGLLVRLGFTRREGTGPQVLRSAQFLSMLPAPTSPDAGVTPQTIKAWEAWMTHAYEPHLAALRDRYGEKADVYSCSGGAGHSIVRVVWRGETIAVTVAFLLHDKGLSSTLMITPLGVVDRYLRATQCRWMQDRVL